MPDCEVCGKHIKRMNYRHTGIHNLSMQEYREMYPQAALDDVDVLQRISDGAKRNYEENPERKIAQSKRQTGKHWQWKEDAKGHDGWEQSQEAKDNNSQKMKELWQDPEFIAKQKQNNPILWDTESRPEQSILAKKLWENPEYRAKQSAAHTKPADLEKYPAKCILCGKNFKAISTRHLKIIHKSTIEEYLLLDSEAIILSVWNKGKTKDTDKRLAKLSKSIEQLWTDEDYRVSQSAALTGRHYALSDEAKINIGKGAKKSWDKTEYRKRQDEQKREYWDKPENKEARSELMKEKYLDPVYVKMIVASQHRKPNKQEMQVMEILDKWDPDQWYYVGDGKLWIAGKNPDFVNYERRHLIEFNGEYWHRDENPAERISHFRKNGWNCSVIWDYNLPNIIELINV